MTRCVCSTAAPDSRARWSATPVAPKDDYPTRWERIHSRMSPNNKHRAVSSPKQVGFQAASFAFDLAFDLGRPVKPRWPNVGLEPCNPAGRRVSRAGPGMALRGGPRFKVCGRVHRAWARCRVVGQERFAYFCASKVRRRKGATLSGRYRRNGYVLKTKCSGPAP